MGTKLQPSQLNSPGKDIESYLASVHSIPILTKEQEQELALKWALSLRLQRVKIFKRRKFLDLTEKGNKYICGLMNSIDLIAK